MLFFTLIVLIKSIYDSYMLNRRIYELDMEDSTISENNNEESEKILDESTFINEDQINLKEKLLNTNDNHNKNSSTCIRQINPELLEMIEDIDQMWSIVPG